MIEKTIAIYVFIDDLLKEIEHKEPTNRNMSDAELITTVLVSAIYFSGHHEKAMSFMSSTKMITHMLSKSRFNRRLHQIGDLIIDLFFQLSSLIKELNPFGHEHLVKNGKAGDLCKKQVMSREEKSNMMLTLVEEWQKSGMTRKEWVWKSDE